jgi:hypothetical protein
LLEEKKTRKKPKTLGAKEVLCPHETKSTGFFFSQKEKNDEKFLVPEKMKEEGKQKSGGITGRDVATLVINCQAPSMAVRVRENVRESLLLLFPFCGIARKLHFKLHLYTRIGRSS